MEVFKSWRDAPAIPRDWKPAPPPGAVRKVPIKNRQVERALRNTLSGKWVKVYHMGVDGSAIHYNQHASGAVALVKHKPVRHV